MRLRVCLGIMLLGLGACETLPAMVRIDVDGSTLEFKKKPVPEAPAPAPAADPAAEPASEPADAGPR